LSVELVGGASASGGRVKITFNNTVGSICGDGWDMNDATVICKMLGYQEARAAISHFGGGSDANIWLTNVDCTGKEGSLKSCNHSGWGNNVCRRNHHAGVICATSGGWLKPSIKMLDSFIKSLKFPSFIFFS
jgi:hypothetical protein